MAISHKEGEVRSGTRSDSPVGAEFIAPHHARVPELIEDLVTFATRMDVPPLIAIAIAHAQFETIHPFTDGNGRTGRALAQAMLRYREITLLDVFARRPVLDSATAAAELGVQQPNAYPPLRALVDAGVVQAKAEHKLGQFWRTDEVLAAVDRFAKRAGRREAR